MEKSLNGYGVTTSHVIGYSNSSILLLSINYVHVEHQVVRATYVDWKDTQTPAIPRSTYMWETILGSYLQVFITI